MTTQQDSVDVERHGNLRVLPATPTEDQRQAARASSLYKHGDMRLMWVNEGDLDALVFAPTAALSLPITQRDEQGERTYADGVEDAAKVADDHAAAWGLAHATPAIAIATAIRRLSIEQGDQDGGTPA